MGEDRRDLLRPQELLLDVHQAAGEPEGLGVAAGDAALTRGRERVPRPLGRVRLQQLHRAGARRRWGGQAGRQPRGATTPASQQVRHGLPRQEGQGSLVGPPVPEGGLDVGDGRPAQQGVGVVPGRPRPVAPPERHRLGVALVPGGVPAAVGEVEAADQRDVVARPARVADHDELLVVAAQGPHPLIEDDLRALARDLTRQVVVGLPGQPQPVLRGAPHQPLEQDTAGRHLRERLGHRGALVPQSLTGVAAPGREEHEVTTVGAVQRRPQGAEVRLAVHQRLDGVPPGPGGQRRGVVPALRPAQEPVVLRPVTGRVVVP